MNKLTNLKNLLSKYNSCLVAFSGGTDSSFLLKVASSVFPKKDILSVTASSATYPNEELVLARKIARSLGVRHKVIKTGELSNNKFLANSPKRCYFCKKELFIKLKKIAKENNLEVVFDASNITDESDFRPGTKAQKELGVISPLQIARLDKAQIRKLSKKLDLVTWDKPALACLASRVPYGTFITKPLLERINKAEVYLRGRGFRQVRVRDYNNFCRIEVTKKDIPTLVKKSRTIIDKLKKLGYNYIAVDLEGYRTGSMNEGVLR